MSVTSWLRKLASVVVAMGALFGIGSVDPVSAAKPGGGGTHTSVILYSTYKVPPTLYQMYEDGTSKSAALPQGLFGIPSSLTYGGSRWWLTVDIDPVTGFEEVFAFRSDGSSTVQLTELGPDGFDLGDQPRWSNDLLDSFVTTQVGLDADHDGVNETYIIRLPVSGADVAAIESGAPRLTGADCEPLLMMPPFSPGDDSAYTGQYACSSDPSKLAYLVDNLDEFGGTIDRTIWVRTLAANPNDPPVDVPIHTTARLKLATWSHDGSRIAFTTSNGSSYGGVWTIMPNGTQLVKVKSNNGTTENRASHWSPNSTELLLLTIKDRGFGVWYYNLARMPAAGGTLTVLTDDLTQSLGKGPEGWVPLGP